MVQTKEQSFTLLSRLSVARILNLWLKNIFSRMSIKKHFFDQYAFCRSGRVAAIQYVLVWPYQQNSRVLCVYVPSKWFGQLLSLSQANYMFLKTLDVESLYTEVWFINKSNKPVEIEHKVS